VDANYTDGRGLTVSIGTAKKSYGLMDTSRNPLSLYQTSQHNDQESLCQLRSGGDVQFQQLSLSVVSCRLVRHWSVMFRHP